MRDSVNCANRRCQHYNEKMCQNCGAENAQGDVMAATCQRYRPKTHVLSFTGGMAEKVAEGDKWQTIRVRAGCKPGDLLSLRRRVGRSKQEVIKDVICSAVKRVRIGAGMGEIDVEGKCLTDDGYGCAYRFAVQDGFKSFVEMQEWFAKRHGLPFEGEVIEWR